MLTKQQKNNRRYKLHYKLRKLGNKVFVKERIITRKQELSDIEFRYIYELISYGYQQAMLMF